MAKNRAPPKDGGIACKAQNGAKDFLPRTKSKSGIQKNQTDDVEFMLN